MADKARVKAEAAAAKAQAESASRTAELLIDQQKEKEEKGEEGVDDDIKKEIADLKKRLEAVSIPKLKCNQEPTPSNVIETFFDLSISYTYNTVLGTKTSLIRRKSSERSRRSIETKRRRIISDEKAIRITCK